MYLDKIISTSLIHQAIWHILHKWRYYIDTNKKIFRSALLFLFFRFETFEIEQLISQEYVKKITGGEEERGKQGEKC